MENDKLRTWEEGVLRTSLARRPERQDGLTTSGGIQVDRVALPADPDAAYWHKLGLPGSYPFTRGVQPTMYRSQIWTMRQYAGYSTAEESNARYRYLLEQGTTGLSVAFDLPTQIGLDSDDSLSAGEVGRVGVAIDSLADLEALFDGIPLGRVSTSMTINAPAAVLLAMYVATGEKQGVSRENLRGTIQNDILKEYLARGTYIFPPRPSLRLVTDVFSWCKSELPEFNTISISGYHIREAGSTAAQEVAFTLANACAYVEAALAAGLTIDSFAGRLTFFFNAATDLFEEVAKFRAARRLWARLMKERFGSRDSRSQMLRFHAQTAGHTLTARQIDNNVVRVTLQALAAVLGGAQSLHTNSRDEALSLPTEDAVRIALRTQQIIAHESFVTNTVDPLGGSYHVEKLTDALEREAAELMERIEKRGGVVKCLEEGYLQRQVEDSAYRYQQEVEDGTRVIIGQNRFADEEGNRPTSGRTDPGIEHAQVARLRQVRVQRDSRAVRGALRRLETVAKGHDNLLPPLLDAVKAYATLGEICGVLRKVFGVYRDRG